MSLVLQNIRKVLKPNSHVLFRDYATGDLAQERLTCKDQKISENFYVRGDGTRAFYFSDEFLRSLFEENGYDVEELGFCCKQVENRLRELVMNRRWIQAVFRPSDDVNSSSCMEAARKIDSPGQEFSEPKVKENLVMGLLNNYEVDMSDGVAVDMFGISPSNDNEIVDVNIGGSNYKIEVLSKEYQHTCKSTGLMLWESARLMASILAGNPTIVAGKRVLELGCGCGGICSMVAVGSADLVAATDGDTNALGLLNQNIISNIKPPFLAKLIMKRLEWGNRNHIEAIREISSGGFDVIMGTDVTYIPEAILPLFATAKELISSAGRNTMDQKPAFILCHVVRRVDEPSILSAASKFGFKLVDKWPTETPNNPSKSIISSWFSEHVIEYIPTSALTVLYFSAE
ncbi:tRNA(Thr) (cytosine(32)-N(3))-methyltransferase [Morella rubra]|uniref:tRNA(Thr) (Cytosine(32)-N(3))-methyltransferase n=1 Tax=Morella rubra TaxID=262757 RepID=A0A6A1VSF9_9ROSI|nr:tRNA(Thr) (cytosine(32)-N(3))-methyltransferase [Morella rubra]